MKIVISRIREYAMLAPHATLDSSNIVLIHDIIVIACELINLQCAIMNIKIKIFKIVIIS